MNMDIETAIIIAAFDDDDEDFYNLLSKVYETSSSSSSSSSSEEDEIILPMKKKRKYIDVTICDEETFRKNFRLHRSTILSVIENFANSDYYSPDSHISAETAVLMTIWYLANPETFGQISVRFDVAKSTSHKIIYNVINWLVNISPNYIKWPDDEIKNSDEFKTICDIEGVVGCLGVTHILTPKPLENPDLYWNKNGKHSILLQGVVDKNKKFIDVFCGEMGSINESTLLKRSSLYKKFTEDCMQEYFILGSLAYPNFPWLVTPFPDDGRLSNDQRIFNYKHFSTRIIADQALGLLKGRFRRLQGFDNSNINFIVQCVVAACVLHNICIDAQDDDVDYELNNVDNVTEEAKTGVIDRRGEIFNKMFSNK